MKQIMQHFVLLQDVLSCLGSCPGSLDFSIVMLLNVPLIGDWHAIYAIACMCEHVIEKLHCIYKNYCQFVWALGQQVPKKTYNPTNCGVLAEDPYTTYCSCSCQ